MAAFVISSVELSGPSITVLEIRGFTTLMECRGIVSRDQRLNTDQLELETRGLGRQGRQRCTQGSFDGNSTIFVSIKTAGAHS